MPKTEVFQFEVLHRSTLSKARTGRITTTHGTIETPAFVGVGTHGALKAIDHDTLNGMGLDLMFCNTYHMMLQPGADVVAKAGGLHKYIGRKGAIITDSGGFQVFSLAYGSVANELKGQGKSQNGGSVLKISEDGVLFRSYRDGSPLWLTPESSVEAQKKLGADIIIPLDELPPYHIDPSYLENSLERTHRWEMRSLQTHLADPRHQAMYAVVHGGINPELRRKSARFLREKEFDGFAIGGSFGKTKEQMFSMLDVTLPELPPEKPIHLLGIADIPSLALAVPLGIDTFDSAYPTRSARHGSLFTHQGNIQISKTIFKEDFTPIEEGCGCHTCRTTTRAYLHHLFKAHELSALTLATIHNLYFMISLMDNYRKLIRNNLI